MEPGKGLRKFVGRIPRVRITEKGMPVMTLP
jgi:hypothetical protein